MIQEVRKCNHFKTSVEDYYSQVNWIYMTVPYYIVSGGRDKEGSAKTKAYFSPSNEKDKHLDFCDISCMTMFFKKLEKK